MESSNSERFNLKLSSKSQSLIALIRSLAEQQAGKQLKSEASTKLSDSAVIRRIAALAVENEEIVSLIDSGIKSGQLSAKRPWFDSEASSNEPVFRKTIVFSGEELAALLSLSSQCNGALAAVASAAVNLALEDQTLHSQLISELSTLLVSTCDEGNSGLASTRKNGQSTLSKQLVTVRLDRSLLDALDEIRLSNPFPPTLTEDISTRLWATLSKKSALSANHLSIFKEHSHLVMTELLPELNKIREALLVVPAVYAEEIDKDELENLVVEFLPLVESLEQLKTSVDRLFELWSKEILGNAEFLSSASGKMFKEPASASSAVDELVIDGEVEELTEYLM